MRTIIRSDGAAQQGAENHEDAGQHGIAAHPEHAKRRGRQSHDGRSGVASSCGAWPARPVRRLRRHGIGAVALVLAAMAGGGMARRLASIRTPRPTPNTTITAIRTRATMIKAADQPARQDVFEARISRCSHVSSSVAPPVACQREL